MKLTDGAKTQEEIKDQFYGIARRMGIFAPPFHHRSADELDFSQELSRDVRNLLAAGWLRQENDRFALTELGNLKAQDRQPNADTMIDQSLAELIERGFLSGRDCITVTRAGEEYLNRHALPMRRASRRSSMKRKSPHVKTPPFLEDVCGS